MLQLNNFPELKTALRIDGSEDDQVLALLIDSAKADLAVAGIPEKVINSELLPLYKRAILLFIEIDYEDDERKINVLKKAYQRTLLQLRASVKHEQEEI